MIVLNDISVDFGSGATKVQAVDHVSLSVKPGEVFGIVGSSGAGKSTLLRTINLLERPSGGQVKVDGVDITHFSNAQLRLERQRIGMIFQHFNLMHTRTVFDNVAFALHIAHKTNKEIHQRVPELLSLVGLSDKADAFPAQLSGGQKQRVGIARAVANRPHILLCDEPTSALDLETSASILQLLKQINERLNITIVLISHEMNVIKSICTRVAVMDHGRVVEEGDVFDIFATPQQEFTRQLVDRTFNLEIPDRLVKSHKGRLLKILFLGDKAEEPVLFEAGKLFGVSVNVLHGKIEYIGSRPVGLLVALFDSDAPDSSAQLDKTEAYIRERTARVEVIHA